MSITIKVTSSSSEGNNYIIESENKILLVELGCSYSSILKMLDYNLGFRKTVGCIVSHRHTDHLNTSTLKHFLDGGIKVFANDDVCTFDNRIECIEENKATDICGFTVQPFYLEHSVKNYGFFIKCPSGEKVLFATDTINIPYIFHGIDCFLVEANYDYDTVIDFVTAGMDVRSAFQTHMNIDDTIRFLKGSFDGKCKRVELIHLSSQNSNADKFVNMVKKELFFNNVDYAKSGDIIKIEDEF